MKKSKVFINSLHKTGTTSLSRFLEKLGYLVTGPDTHLFIPAIQKDYDEIDRFLNRYDAFQDDPWYLIYPYLERQHPTAKFVFLERDENSWIKSVQNFYDRDRYNNSVRRVFYGNADTIASKNLYLDKYRSHKKEVFDYFKNRENFISISIAENNDAIRLQNFLGEPVRFKSFPHKNRAPTKKNDTIKKGFRFMVYDGLGFKQFAKRQLFRILGPDEFILFRSKIRFIKAKGRVFFLNFLK